jgi:hypothetical protein
VNFAETSTGFVGAQWEKIVDLAAVDETVSDQLSVRYQP